jgi:hypothetical protein
MRVKEGMGCSQFEAQALTDLVKEVYFPWLAQPEAIQAGQLNHGLCAGPELAHGVQGNLSGLCGGRAAKTA